MKTVVVLALLFLAVATGYQGYIYREFNNCLDKSERSFYSQEYNKASTAINELRDNRWYKPIKKYPRLDIFEIDKQLDYQNGRVLAEMDNFKEAYALFDSCANARNSELASLCLYQQGNVAYYQGNSVAEKKWQASLEKSADGQDFDAQVNLELLKRRQNKSKATETAAILNHRRNNKLEFNLRQPPAKKEEKTIKP